MGKISNKIQLITYADSLGKNLQELDYVLDNFLSDIVKGVHILPFFPSNGDRGFSPLTHLEVDSEFGNWDDIKKIGKKYELTFDLIVNHIASDSIQFKDYLQRGEQSQYKDWFITAEKFSQRIKGNFRKKFNEKLLSNIEVATNYFRKLDKLFHYNGVNRFSLNKIYRPRPGSPFVKHQFANGKSKHIWCTFTQKQIDIDIKNSGVEEYIYESINKFAENGVNLIRLDACGYIGKVRGSNCFYTQEAYDFTEKLANFAHEHNVGILPEVHNHYTLQKQLSDLPYSDYIYDFALPLITIYTLQEKDNKYLKNWLEIRPNECITTLDTHDGIGVVDVEDLMSPEDIAKTQKKLYEIGGNIAERSSGFGSDNVDTYQINCTYYSALEEDDDKYIVSRAIQFFVPGIPQVYYVGLLAGENDVELLEKTNNGRDINRHYYSIEEIEKEIKRDVVKRLFSLIKFRNTYPAFDGRFQSLSCNGNELKLRWEKDDLYCQLDLDLTNAKGTISYVDIETKEVLSFELDNIHHHIK